MQDIPLLLDSKLYFFISHMIGLTDLPYPSPAEISERNLCQCHSLSINSNGFVTD